MDRLELLTKLEKEMREHNAKTKKLTLALKMLNRIKKVYPYIFWECITEEEVNNLCGK